MSKKLSDMTLEELWQLFPVILAEHDDKWNDRYSRMEAELRAIIPMQSLYRISHIGSTAIPGIKAKPIVDILVEHTADSDLLFVKSLLIQSKWICMCESDYRMSFNLGYTEAGFADEVFHLHLRFAGDNDELYFRDYLLMHADVAIEYETLKLSLAEKYRYNRDAYTEAKSNFIRKYTDFAKLDFPYMYD